MPCCLGVTHVKRNVIRDLRKQQLMELCLVMHRCSSDHTCIFHVHFVFRTTNSDSDTASFLFHNRMMLKSPCFFTNNVHKQPCLSNAHSVGCQRVPAQQQNCLDARASNYERSTRARKRANIEHLEADVHQYASKHQCTALRRAPRCISVSHVMRMRPSKGRCRAPCN